MIFFNILYIFFLSFPHYLLVSEESLYSKGNALHIQAFFWFFQLKKHPKFNLYLQFPLTWKRSKYNSHFTENRGKINS